METKVKEKKNTKKGKKALKVIAIILAVIIVLSCVSMAVTAIANKAKEVHPSGCSFIHKPRTHFGKQAVQMRKMHFEKRYRRRGRRTGSASVRVAQFILFAQSRLFRGRTVALLTM